MSVKEAIGVQEARVIFQNWLKSHPSDATDSAGLVATMSVVDAHKCGG